MSETAQLSPIEVPSKGKILKATGVALIVALIVLFTAVLPAEYGIDPLGTGKAMGLSNLSAAKEAAPAAASALPPGAVNFVRVPGPTPEAVTVEGAFTSQPAGYKVDSQELLIRPGRGIEIKYHMQQNAGLVYSWTASAPIRFEFHAEPDVKPADNPDYYETYEQNYKEGKTQGFGTFTAPATGIHGWWWENASGENITVKLHSAGFYDYIYHSEDGEIKKLPPSDPK